MSFFIKGTKSVKTPIAVKKATISKRKGDVDAGGKTKGKKQNSKYNEEISSDSETESSIVAKKRPAREEHDFDETPQEKKLRLAKLYLNQLKEQEEEKGEDEAFETEVIAGRLQEEVLEHKGKLQRLIAKDLLPPDTSEIRLLRGHKLPITCLVISPDDKCIFSASKDCSIIKWDIESGKKLRVIPGGRKGTEDRHIGHTAHVLCMSISSDAKYLATGDMNKLIMIWEAETCKHLYKFTGHKGPVSGLSFRKGTHDLYSASHDRSIKVWNVDENAYVETLFGHQDAITGLDSLSRERCVTAGGRDRTVRVWKIAEESQLVFHGHEGSIDCIQLINEEHMVTGADDGSVCLWSVNKKKPLSTVKQAHGCHGNVGLEQPHWVAAVAALQNTDVVASGSSNSQVQLWKCGQNYRGLEQLFSIPVIGFVNSLKFSHSGHFLVAGVGQEHRLGRWWRQKEAKNGIFIIPLKRKPPNQDQAQTEE
ncbi:U3 small nucleolar RNA-interacting protein 2 isoform X2 [Corythoichthys intestinalis]|uniref:U3 small nucleolar RNA-interacting protein 2 isoform X2 n=1 Tax=Corythoichthys intestinalis TaxID=161448 RepID=UPI0025A53C4F|nr:U3 small nucleolar RNA-interacting protein 2 isoform X2 [Corythoichthys intestinalis]XP_061813639.1 U3 small nucleolar RNA-interacting protein 2-like [Nerophis lumbriciformis]